MHLRDNCDDVLSASNWASDSLIAASNGKPLPVFPTLNLNDNVQNQLRKTLDAVKAIAIPPSPEPKLMLSDLMSADPSIRRHAIRAGVTALDLYTHNYEALLLAREELSRLDADAARSREGLRQLSIVIRKAAGSPVIGIVDTIFRQHLGMEWIAIETHYLPSVAELIGAVREKQKHFRSELDRRYKLIAGTLFILFGAVAQESEFHEHIRQAIAEQERKLAAQGEALADAKAKLDEQERRLREDRSQRIADHERVVAGLQAQLRNANQAFAQAGRERDGRQQELLDLANETCPQGCYYQRCPAINPNCCVCSIHSNWINAHTEDAVKAFLNSTGFRNVNTLEFGNRTDYAQLLRIDARMSTVQ